MSKVGGAYLVLLAVALCWGCVGDNSWDTEGGGGGGGTGGDGTGDDGTGDDGTGDDGTGDDGIGDEPAPEVCNGYDDNGDGVVDEDCACAAGHSQACFPGPEGRAGIGVCRMGVQTCDEAGEFGGWGPCVDAVGPGVEVCGDGIDQDCDGADLPCETRDMVDAYIYGEEGGARPVDIVWAIDQSGSMGDEIANVQRNINTFAEVIAASGIDYHVIMVAARTHDPDDHEVCVPPPLAGPGCADSERFRQIDRHVDSHDALYQIQNNIGAIEAFMRPGSLRVFVVVSDDESNLGAGAFDGWLRARGGYDDYVFDAIVGIDDDVCDDIADEGDDYVVLAAWTDGIAEHICTRDWGLTFEGMAEDIIERNVVFALSAVPVPGTIRLFYVPAPGVEEEQPEGAAWFYDAGTNSVNLLPGHTPADGTAIEIRYQVSM